MKVTIEMLDSGTGELTTIHDYSIAEFTGAEIAKAVEKDLADAAGDLVSQYEWHKVEHFMPIKGRPHEASFVLSTVDPYFGPIHVVGMAYLDRDLLFDLVSKDQM